MDVERCAAFVWIWPKLKGLASGARCDPTFHVKLLLGSSVQHIFGQFLPIYVKEPIALFGFCSVSIAKSVDM